MRTLSRIVGTLTCVVFVLWICGMILSDRWLVSQWLAWIPSPLVMFLALCSSGLFFVVKQKFMGFLLLWFAITISVWFLVFERKTFDTSDQTGDFTIVSWTMSHSKQDVAMESAEVIVKLQGDVTLLTHGWYVRGQESIRQWVNQGGYKVVNSQFTLLSKHKPISVQTIIASDDVYISSFILDTTEVLGDVLVLWAIDLPSSVWDSKMEIAHRVQQLLTTIEYTPPDVVMGDFNMTRNSAAMKAMFPELSDVSNEVGVGFLGSFPMNVPLYHIDHTLMNNRFTPVRYELINPHIGRHRIQYVEIDNSKDAP